MDNNDFIEYITMFFLLFGKLNCYIPIILLGFILFRRYLFAQAICTLFVTMILNILLKNIFKIPLNPNLNIEGYAFPSGHMIAAITFYGWFFVKIKNNIIKTIIIIILTGLGFALINQNYHDLIDIIGAITFGMMIIAFAYSLTKEQIIQKYPYLFGFTLWLLTVPMVSYLEIIDPS